MTTTQELIDWSRARSFTSLDDGEIFNAIADHIESLSAEVERKETIVKSWLRANAPGGWIDDMRAQLEAQGEAVRSNADWLAVTRDLIAERDAAMSEAGAYAAGLERRTHDMQKKIEALDYELRLTRVSRQTQGDTFDDAVSWCESNGIPLEPEQLSSLINYITCEKALEPTQADAELLAEVLEQFDDCEETEVDHAVLMRFVSMGLLDCTRYEATPKGIDLAATVETPLFALHPTQPKGEKA